MIVQKYRYQHFCDWFQHINTSTKNMCSPTFQPQLSLNGETPKLTEEFVYHTEGRIHLQTFTPLFQPRPRNKFLSEFNSWKCMGLRGVCRSPWNLISFCHISVWCVLVNSFFSEVLIPFVKLYHGQPSCLTQKKQWQHGQYPQQRSCVAWSRRCESQWTVPQRK